MEQKERNRELNIIYFERMNKLEQLTARLGKCQDALELYYEDETAVETHSEAEEGESRDRTIELSRQLKGLKDTSLKLQR